MASTRGTVRLNRGARGGAPDAARHTGVGLRGVAADGATVLLLGFEELDDACWAVLVNSGIRLERVADVAGALCYLTDHGAAVVIAPARWAGALTAAVRARREVSAAHVVIGAALDSPRELREALDAGADDVIGVPFEPEVLVARVAAGLRAARLRADEALWRSLVDNIPGALYRCAFDTGWTMEWVSDEIEAISGYPASSFINSSERTFASVIHPEDRKQVEQSVNEAVQAGRPFSLEYRIQRRDGGVRWVLERGQARESGDGRCWLDGAIFDITVRREATQQAAALEERHRIARDLHDSVSQSLFSLTLHTRTAELALERAGLDPEGDLGRPLRQVSELTRGALAEMRALIFELRPGALAEEGLGAALSKHSAAVTAREGLEITVQVPDDRLPLAVEQEEHLYRLAQEALHNAVKHAQAKHAWVELAARDGAVVMTVRDDGVGFDPAEPRPGHFGLETMRERASRIGAELRLESAPGAGTRVQVQVPEALATAPPP